MQKSERRLTTIMFTDIFGYSGLMNNNEKMAFELLEAHNRITSEIIELKNGTIIKRIGDALLVEFSAVLDAYYAAMEIQNEIKKFNKTQASKERLILRIGIHIGDVMHIDNDVLGDGVNIAARLQQIAVPGGICLSEAAYASIRGQLDHQLVKAENVELKNIADTYTVFMSPSIYPDEFPLTENPKPTSTSHGFNIKSMTSIPPEKFSFVDSLLIALGIVVAYDFILANIIVKIYNDTLNEAILYLSNPGFLAVNLLFVALIVLIIMRSAVRIKFEDIKGVDHALNFIIKKAGFKDPYKRNGEIIFKPTIYNFLMWGTQKMRVSISGNSVFMSGSYIFIRRVKKLLRAYQG